ncbi:unnamed protein product, partial [Echinostoma caproni]|uniref:C2H2-type domain-containing protein n=1 Tax=Echinostoma caproni TaxID=27848 RepID=A0A183AT24_9TREM
MGCGVDKDKANGMTAGGADIFTTFESEDQATFYQPGMELTELWCDLERALNEAVLYQPLSFLAPSPHQDDVASRPLGFPVNLGDCSPYSLWRSSLIPDSSDRSSVAPLSFRLNSPTRTNPDSCPFPLPNPDSPLAQTILLYAGVDLWKSHLFLSAFCQQTRQVRTQLDSFSAPIVICEDNEQDEPQESDPDVTIGPVSEHYLSYLTASAPSPVELSESLCSLDQCTNLAKSKSTCTEASTVIEGQSHSTTTGFSTLTNIAASGLIRCLICNFRAHTAKEMQHHLSGAQPFTLTKCALCGQAVCIRHPNLCAVKAHLLLHLDCYLMCPQCGFTPPAHLNPDSAELCMRIHLRFICFHYNVLQVYLCARCHDQGKAFHSLTNLCQHYFDRHSTRVYACLWCLRSTTNQVSVSSTVTASGTNGIEKHSSTGYTDSVQDALEPNRGPDAPSDPQSDGRSLSPETSATLQKKPIFSFASSRELLFHIRNAHRHVLTPSTSMAPSTTSASVTTTTTTTTITGINNNKSSDTINSTVMMIRPSDSTEALTGYSAVDGEVTASDTSGIGPSTVKSCTAADKRASIGNAVVTSDGSNNADAFTGLRSGDNPMPLCLVHGVDFSCGYKCSECIQVFDNRDTFARHFRSYHPLAYSSVCCYRCFGSCKRLSYKLEEFRRHAANCTSARRMFMYTFTSQRNRATIYPFDHSSSNLMSNSSGNPLCFCSYCGIGARRLDNPTVVTAPATRPNSPKSPSDSPAHLVIDEQEPDTAPLIRTSSNRSMSTDSLALMPQQATTREPMYDACYFSSLSSLRTHESQYHGFENNSQIACPWCGHRLSCYRRQDLHVTITHLGSHLRKHNLASWTMERKRRWNKPNGDLPLCSCGSALLDSPMALASHCSVHLLSRNPLLTHRGASLRPDPASRTNQSGTIPTLNVTENDSDSPMPLDRSDSNIRSASTAYNRLLQPMRSVIRPSPTAHIPCSMDVYRHLRFAEFPDLDHYLSEALEDTRQPFVCPMCDCRTATRWALTEHAFVEHWGVLCFVCCTDIISDTKKSYTNAPSNHLGQAVVVSDTLQSDSSHDLTSSKSRPLRELSPQSSYSASAPTTDPMSGKQDDDGSSSGNFWTHLHHCMHTRGQAVRRSRRTLLETSSEDRLVNRYPPVANSASHVSQDDPDMVIVPLDRDHAY